MNLDHLNDVILSLDKQSAGDDSVGAFEIRIPSHPSFDLHIGVKKPSQVRTYRLRVPEGALPVADLPALGGLLVSRDTVTTQAGPREDLVLSTSSSAYNDVFLSLVTDLIDSIEGESSPVVATTATLRRLVMWQRFLERLRDDGLTQEEQRGLFGELMFLQDHVLQFLDHAAAIECWAGPDGGDRDFECSGIGFEVKTILGPQRNTVRISNEHQLSTASGSLYLCCWRLEVAPEGTTLAALVQSVRTALSADEAILRGFEDKIRSAGYFDFQGERYDRVRYATFPLAAYFVGDGFPRISAETLPPGVSAVSYTVDLGLCGGFEVPQFSFGGIAAAAQGGSTNGH